MKLKIPPPLTCEQSCSMFNDHIYGKLDAERKGRVTGHLRSCESCSEAFSVAMDKAEENGTLPLPPRKPLLAHLAGTTSPSSPWKQVVTHTGGEAWELVQEALFTVTDKIVNILSVPPGLELAWINLSRERAVSIEAPSQNHGVTLKNSLSCPLPNTKFTLNLVLRKSSKEAEFNILVLIAGAAEETFSFELKNSQDKTEKETQRQQKCGGNPAAFLGLSTGQYVLQIQEPSGKQFSFPFVLKS